MSRREIACASCPATQRVSSMRYLAPINGVCSYATGRAASGSGISRNKLLRAVTIGRVWDAVCLVPERDTVHGDNPMIHRMALFQEQGARQSGCAPVPG